MIQCVLKQWGIYVFMVFFFYSLKLSAWCDPVQQSWWQRIVMSYMSPHLNPNLATSLLFHHNVSAVSSISIFNTESFVGLSIFAAPTISNSKKPMQCCGNWILLGIEAHDAAEFQIPDQRCLTYNWIGRKSKNPLPMPARRKWTPNKVFDTRCTGFQAYYFSEHGMYFITFSGMHTSEENNNCRRA